MSTCNAQFKHSWELIRGLYCLVYFFFIAVTKFQEIRCNKTCAHNLLSRLLDWSHHVSILSLYTSILYIFCIYITRDVLHFQFFSEEMHLILIESSHIVSFNCDLIINKKITDEFHKFITINCIILRRYVIFFYHTSIEKSCDK